MRTANAWLCLAAAAAFFVVAAGHQAEARPKYFQTFMEQYPALKGQAQTLKCAVCHGGKEGKTAKIRSDYAKSLEEALELKKSSAGKNVPEKDVAKIKAALEKIESKKPEGGTETYGELLKAGKLPPAPEPKE